MEGRRKVNENRERLPDGIKRLDNRRLVVDVKRRFADGTAFRRTKDFNPEALKTALNFLARAESEFARGNGVGKPLGEDAVLTVGAWADHCLNVAMPAQKNGRAPKYSDDALIAFREIARKNVFPRLGEIPLADLDKKTVTELMSSLPSNEIRAKVLNVLTRIMELAETKEKRRRGTNPCKGVSVTTTR